MTVVVGLTGGIATGKTTLARFAEAEGVPVFYADKAVAGLYQTPEVLLELAKAFPEAGFLSSDAPFETVRKIAVDREALLLLEKIMHPLVGQKAEEFIAEALKNNAPLVLLEVPLLFQSGMDALCSYVIALQVPEEIQRQRALDRQGMTEKKFSFLHERQNSGYKNKADFIIDTSCSITDAEQALKTILAKIKGEENGSKSS